MPQNGSTIMFNPHQLTFATLLILLSQSMVTGQSVEVKGTTMGVISFRVLVVTDDHGDEKLERLKNDVNDSLQRVNELMSTYIEDSDISKFNRSESTDWQSVDLETATVVQRSLEICEQTKGAFDPTVGPAVNAWNFGPGKKEQPEPPSAQQVDELLKLVGYENLEARLEPPAIRKSIANVKLDLSAIAKGYAVDRVGKTLRALGYENFMVVVGGEVFTSGQRDSGGPWNVAIENPDAAEPSGRTGRDSKGSQRVVKLSDQAIASSGDYRNFFEFEGQRYSHTIDPTTCKPVDHGMATASVIADDCMTADALATAVMVMGHEKGAALCQRLGYPLITVRSGGSDDAKPFIEAITGDFPFSKDNMEGSDDEADPSEQSRTDTSSSESILPVFAATFVIFCLVVCGMAVGAIFNNKPVTGSCGGLANMTNDDGETVCGICSKPTVDCEEVDNVTA